MPRRRMNARTIREILRLKSLDLSTRQISRSVKKAKSSIQRLVRRAEQVGLRWPLDVDDRKLEEMLYAGPGVWREGRPLPDWSYIHGQLKRKGVTRQLLWKECADAYPDNHYSYTRFCELYSAWRAKNSEPSMRQLHKAGEKCFVDYAGVTVEITDPETAEVTRAQIFVGVMGASNYIFAEATASQSLEHWLRSHTRMLEFFGGVPEIIVPDNLRSGVSKACRYDPDTNPAYAQWANHYGTVIIPARPGKPKDKAKVETGVQIVERSVLAPIRDEVFFSLQELNGRVRELLREVNSKPFQKLPGSRGEQFERIDLPALGSLPPCPYTYTEIKGAKVGIDYHVEHKKKLYSVPYIHRGERVEVHASENLVMIYFKNRFIAQHKRLGTGRYSTEPAHMPEGHREHEKWTPRRLRNWAKGLGSEVFEWVDAQLASRDHPEQAYRVCLGLLNLSRDYPQRLNLACGVANRNGLVRLRQIKEILKNGMDRSALPQEQGISLPQDHENIRGPEQYR